jgi:DNA-binding NarL/FixJ family response regulator
MSKTPRRDLEVDSAELVRVGLLSLDPLRMLGLETILSEKERLEVVALSEPGSVELGEFALVVIDAGCTEHLLELVGGFRRRYPKLKLIVVGMETDQDYIQRVIGSGAKGYLTHLANEAEIKMAVEIVLDGSVWAPRKVLAKLIDKAGATEAGPAAVKAPKITAREDEVLRLLVAGRPNRDIGRAMGIDEGTVKAHVGRLMRKMGVENRIALTMLAVEKKLVAGANLRAGRQ